MKLNKYLPFAFLYFFVNSLGLPLGLTYTALLAPFFYWWLFVRQGREVVHPFLIVALPFFIQHLVVDSVNEASYFVSWFNIIAVYIFSQAVYSFLKTSAEPGRLFTRLLVFNFIACLIAALFYFTAYSPVFWIEQKLTEGVTDFKRLKLFTYEASHYAVLFVPLFCFFLLQYMFRQNKIPPLLLLPMIFLPFVLSFSMGVIGCLLLSGVIVFLLYGRLLITNHRIFNSLLTGFVCCAVVVVFCILFFRDNPVFIRVMNIFSGDDTSGEGRTANAFYLAGRIIEGKEYWGIGPGQLKESADLVRSYYLYTPDTAVAIPNAVAETLVVFGWIGIAVRFVLLIGLFFIVKLWRNYFQLLLFVFMFFYQFTGSYITNTAEYVIWVLAFTNVFPRFDVSALRQYRAGSHSAEQLSTSTLHTAR